MSSAPSRGRCGKSPRDIGSNGSRAKNTCGQELVDVRVAGAQPAAATISAPSHASTSFTIANGAAPVTESRNLFGKEGCEMLNTLCINTGRAQAAVVKQGELTTELCTRCTSSMLHVCLAAFSSTLFESWRGVCEAATRRCAVVSKVILGYRVQATWSGHRSNSRRVEFQSRPKPKTGWVFGPLEWAPASAGSIHASKQPPSTVGHRLDTDVKAL